MSTRDTILNPIDLFERDARDARDSALACFKLRHYALDKSKTKHIRARIKYAKFMRDFDRGPLIDLEECQWVLLARSPRGIELAVEAEKPHGA